MSFFRRMFGSDEPSENLRIIITRHGERADLEIGKNWFERMQRGVRDPRVSYLARRPHTRDWNYDPPLTVNGESQSARVGQKLRKLGYKIDYCYSSPSYRAVQTATKILEAQRRSNVPINIEPGLFECPAWYHGKPLSFIPTEYLAVDRNFNINPGYSPLFSQVDASEDEGRYYRRSGQLIRSIIQAHKYQGGTVLLSAHAGSIEALTRGLRGVLHRRGRPEHLIQEALRVDYCNFAILERDARTGQWVVQTPELLGESYGAQLSRQSIIPLYGINTQHITRQRVGRMPPRRSRSPVQRHRHSRRY